MPGEVGILNVGAGDTKLTFDPKNPAEVKRSAKIVKDMKRCNQHPPTRPEAGL